ERERRSRWGVGAADTESGGTRVGHARNAERVRAHSPRARGDQGHPRTPHPDPHWTSRSNRRHPSENRIQVVVDVPKASTAVVAGTMASYAIGWAIGVPVLVPFLNTLAAFPFMVAALRQGNIRLAVARMLVWALAMGVSATALTYAQPARTETLFLRGQAYRAEMFAWVMTGRGAESSPRQFLPQHARDAAIFSTLAVAT